MTRPLGSAAVGVEGSPAAAGTPTDDPFDDVLRIGEWDWWLTAVGIRLHAADTVDIDGEYETSGKGRTVCGRRSWLSIPGLGDRLDAQRCEKCCDALGFPRGVGSPKNDEACRPLVEARIAERGL